MTNKYVIQIPKWRPATLNSLITVHWSTANQLKRSDKGMVAHYCKDIPKATGKRLLEVNILMGKKQRKCDPDAFHKSLCDALVACGMLVDDSDKYVTLAPVTQGRPKINWYGTIITLTDI